MNPEVVNVKPEKNYMLHLWFENGEEGLFDVKPYLDYEVFQALKDEKMFRTVRPFIGTDGSSFYWDNTVGKRGRPLS